MPPQARPERTTQNRVIALFTDTSRSDCLGYDYLGTWHERPGNRCIETELLQANLTARGYAAAQISAALRKLEIAAETAGTDLYPANMRVYQLLRYGVQVSTGAGQHHDTVHLIDWEHPEANHFALAEEVTLRQGHTRRPDIVLYVNGLAVAVLELKRVSVSVSEAIHQLLSNQDDLFNQGFFSTAQLLFAGNDSEGLYYGTVGTPEEFFVPWKVPHGNDVAEGALLDRPLAEFCAKERLLDMMRNFVIFDGGRKKVPRQHQYDGVKAAQERIAKGEGGVIWHTQGSGKSILMVLIAKWLLEYDSEARILIVTDRDELDKQIEGVMKNAGVISPDTASPRVTSRAELLQKLTGTTPRLLCALIHKFDSTDLKGPAPAVHGRFYVFVDECHRTQGGDMNTQMKRWLANAIFIGFTGTPLLRRDKKTTREVFGTYIHSYKFHQAVADKVVLDLKYEARDVPQELSSSKKIDEWFAQTARKLQNDYQRAVLRKHWATMEKVMSSEGRKGCIIASINHDFKCRPRLNNGRGTAILVAASIYDACHYFRMFKNTPLGEYCGIVTSFEPNKNAVSDQPKGSDEWYKYETYTKDVLKQGQTTAKYEEEMKRQFIDEPANRKLLIVVSKLLTGFDAPSCTYIYLDNEMYDHNLFQAICRTNRLDGEDKTYGYIVDFKALFKNVEEAIAVYTSDELDTEKQGQDDNVYVKDRLAEGKKQLDLAREELKQLCEPVPLPRGIEQHLLYFCGNADDPEALTQAEPLRISFYKATTKFLRAFAELEQDLEEAGYGTKDIAALHEETNVYAEIRNAIKQRAGEELDLKPFEQDMRYLINTYITADSAEGIGSIDQYSLVELIIETNIHDAIARKLNKKLQGSKKAVGEAIINNMRKTIIREKLTDPKFYEKMSKLLQDLIKLKNDATTSYEEFLQKAEEAVRNLHARLNTAPYPEVLDGKAEAIVLYNNLPSIKATTFRYPTSDEARAELALDLDNTVRENAQANWKGDEQKEKRVQNALYPKLDKDPDATMDIFEIAKNQPGY